MFKVAQITQPIRELSMQESLVTTLLDVTKSSTHSYEMGVHRLLLDVIELHQNHSIDHGTYLTVIGTAVDVLFFFNYDHELLMAELNVWYRASIIHQLGQGMLQTLEKLRPELTSQSFYREAMSALALTRQIPHPVTQIAASLPLNCKQWAS